MTGTVTGSLTVSLAAVLLSVVVPSAGQTATLDGKFRGTYICEKLPTTRAILRVPLDLTVTGDLVRFARPRFGLRGRRVIGSELASGRIDSDGKVQLTSEWTLLGNTAKGDYRGTLTSSGGTLTGTQTWTGRQGASPVVRTCTVALVPAPEFHARSQHQ